MKEGESINISDEIKNELFLARDLKYHSFHSSLLPNIKPKKIIGVRAPILRKIAKKFKSHPDVDAYLNDLPHKYYDENAIHSFIISDTKDFDKTVSLVENFLPYVDNWAICDSLTPKAFKSNAEALLPYIYKWISSESEYTVRFAVKMLMDHFLDDLFDIKYMELVASVRSDKYYVNMMLAWYFATALAKQEKCATEYIKGERLPVWVHNKAIQKAVESYRISTEQKEFLKTLRKN